MAFDGTPMDPNLLPAHTRKSDRRRLRGSAFAPSTEPEPHDNQDVNKDGMPLTEEQKKEKEKKGDWLLGAMLFMSMMSPQEDDDVFNNDKNRRPNDDPKSKAKMGPKDTIELSKSGRARLEAQRAALEGKVTSGEALTPAEQTRLAGIQSRLSGETIVPRVKFTMKDAAMFKGGFAVAGGGAQLLVGGAEAYFAKRAEAMAMHMGPDASRDAAWSAAGASIRENFVDVAKEAALTAAVPYYGAYQDWQKGNYVGAGVWTIVDTLGIAGSLVSFGAAEGLVTGARAAHAAHALNAAGTVAKVGVAAYGAYELTAAGRTMYEFAQTEVGRAAIKGLYEEAFKGGVKEATLDEYVKGKLPPGASPEVVGVISGQVHALYEANPDRAMTHTATHTVAAEAPAPTAGSGRPNHRELETAQVANKRLRVPGAAPTLQGPMPPAFSDEG